MAVFAPRLVGIFFTISVLAVSLPSVNFVMTHWPGREPHLGIKHSQRLVELLSRVSSAVQTEICMYLISPLRFHSFGNRLIFWIMIEFSGDFHYYSITVFLIISRQLLSVAKITRDARRTMRGLQSLAMVLLQPELVYGFLGSSFVWSRSLSIGSNQGTRRVLLTTVSINDQSKIITRTLLDGVGNSNTFQTCTCLWNLPGKPINTIVVSRREGRSLTYSCYETRE